MIDPSNADTQVQCVSNFDALVSTPFQHKINALCWNRELHGDFSEIVDQIEFDGNMIELSKETLLDLQLSEEGQTARARLLSDLQLLTEHGASPVLNVIKNYERDDLFPFFPTDVYSYHVDRSPVPTSTFLCTYHGAASDIIANASATQKILIPEIRSELKKIHDGNDEEFDAFLSENFFDLHYQANENAVPTNLGIGHIWRLAVDHPQSDVLPCVHRAPEEKDGIKRLLLIC